MAENNSSSPLKTAEGAAHQLLIALRTIAAYPVTNLLMNMDAANMQRIAVRALEAQAAPAAVAAPDEREAFEKWAAGEGINIRTDGGCYRAVVACASYRAWQTRAALAATPALPATEDSSAGDLAEGQASTLQEIAIEELYQLGYTVKDGRLVPPDHVGELIAVVQASACGCQEGTCETKANRACRMTAEIREQAQAEVQADPVAVLKGAPYEPTSTMLIAAREIDPALPVDAIRAIWWAMWRTAPQAQPADALDAEPAASAAGALLEALESIVDDSDSFDYDGGPSEASMIKARAAIAAYRATPEVAHTQPADAQVRDILCKLVDQLEQKARPRSGNAPYHAHDVPGIWDSDNGAMAGTACAWCALWARAKQIRTAMAAAQEGGNAVKEA